MYAQPSIAAGGVYNVASYTPTGLPGAPIAQGSLFVVFGKNMGPAALAVAPSPLPTLLSGTSLSVTINGTKVTPFMYYTSAGQLGALMPSTTPVGTGTITVTYNGAVSATQPITVVASSVGIFTVNQAGSGPGIITSPSYVVNSLTTAAASGDAVIIWATGMGPVSAAGNEAAGTAALATVPSTFKVFVGGVSATIYGAARSAYPGLDQIVFFVPAGVTGCHVPVVVQSGSIVSNFVTMSIGTGGICSDPAGLGNGLTPTQLTQLQQKGTVAIGGISLDRATTGALSFGGFTVPGTTSDSGSASFTRYTFQQYTAATGGLNITTYGACTVFFVTGSSTSPVDPITPTPLDAGPSFTVTGPGGSKTLTQQTKGYYGTTLGSGTSLYLGPGNYSVVGTGGADVGPINTNVTLPPTLNWTNVNAITTVNRASGQLITWTGGDPSGTVNITGFSGSSAVSAGFVCTARDSDLQFTIPSVVLLSLPPTPAGGIASGGIGFLSVGAESAIKTFTATGLDLASIFASTTTSSFVTYQ